LIEFFSLAMKNFIYSNLFVSINIVGTAALTYFFSLSDDPMPIPLAIATGLFLTLVLTNVIVGVIFIIVQLVRWLLGKS